MCSSTDFYVYAQDYKDLPDKPALAEAAAALRAKYLSPRCDMYLYLVFLTYTDNHVYAYYNNYYYYYYTYYCY